MVGVHLHMRISVHPYYYSNTTNECCSNPNNYYTIVIRQIKRLNLKKRQPFKYLERDLNLLGISNLNYENTDGTY